MSQDIKAIEWVGYGNLGREVVARLIAQDIILKEGLQDKIENLSSGTHTFDSDSEQKDYYMRKIVHRALGRNLYNHSNNIKVALADNNVPFIKDYFDSILPKFKEEEQQYLNEALKYFNIKNDFKLELNPTIALPNTSHIFCVEEANETIVKKLYSEHPNSPKIHRVSFDGKKIEGAFGRTKDKYFTMFEQVKTYVEEKLPQVFSDLNLK